MEIKSILERYILDEILITDQKKKIDPDESLISSGVIDSLSLLRIIDFVEKKFDVKVEDTEVVPENFESINVMESLIAGKLK
jgi:acyl carrier protein